MAVMIFVSYGERESQRSSAEFPRHLVTDTASAEKGFEMMLDWNVSGKGTRLEESWLEVGVARGMVVEGYGPEIGRSTAIRNWTMKKKT